MGLREDLRGKNFLETPLGQSVLRYRRLFIVASQVFLIVFGYFLAFFLRFEARPDTTVLGLFAATLPWLAGIKILVFYYFDLYRGWWRYVGMDDLIDIIRAATVSSFLFITVSVFLFPGFPRSIYMMDWFITITFIGGIRFGLRAFREKLLHERVPEGANVLIYGSRQIGVELLKEIRNNPALRMNVVGFIDDFAPKKGFKIHGVSILGGREEIPRILEQHPVDEIIITSPSLKPKELKDLIIRFREANVRFKIVPPMSDILNNRVSVRHLRDVCVEDLLGRKTVALDGELIRSQLEGKVVLITGAGGSIGSELCRQVAVVDPETIVMFERSENALFMIQWELATHFPHVRTVPVIGDILDRAKLNQVMADHKPQVVFHAAAYKHVPMMELHPVEAIRNNVEGTLNTALAAIERDVERFVFISTDKAVRPMNIMGMTKRIGEMILQSLHGKEPRTKFIAVRFGNVMGSSGSVIPLFQRQVSDGGPVTVTHPKAQRYFMTVTEAVLLVMQATAMGEGGEIYVLEMGEQINIAELARNLIRLSGLEPDKDIEIKYIGLRPGEKLSEELFTASDAMEATRHNKIWCEPSAHIGVTRDFDPRVRELMTLAQDGRVGEAVDLMRRLTRHGPAETVADAHPPAVLHQPRRDA